jgi:DUF971 family protein
LWLIELDWQTDLLAKSCKLSLDVDAPVIESCAELLLAYSPSTMVRANRSSSDRCIPGK